MKSSYTWSNRGKPAEKIILEDTPQYKEDQKFREEYDRLKAETANAPGAGKIDKITEN